MQDWKDALAGMLADPSLPEGEPEKIPASSRAKKSWNVKNLKYFYEKKGRAGKPATIITGFDGASDDEVEEIASRLKKKLGCGGSARGGEILLQGDRREAARRLLEEM